MDLPDPLYMAHQLLAATYTPMTLGNSYYFRNFEKWIVPHG